MSLTIESLRPIYPKYDYKYTADPRSACATYLSEANPFNLPPPAADAPRKEPPACSVHHIDAAAADIDWRGRARGQFHRYIQAAGANPVCTKTTGDCKAPEAAMCRGRTRTRCTQTRYRESSAQTHSYLPEVAGNKRNYEHFEIYQISKLLDTSSPPGVYEANVVERARRRLQFEKALKQVAHDKTKSHAILEAMEWQSWIAREEDIQNIQALRMDIVMRLFREREGEYTATSQKRIEIGANRIQEKQRATLKKINVEYLRAMRQLEARRQNVVTNYRKGNIAENHVNPASDLRAPQMRFGVNPNRRHFISFRKNFDDRINELDKRKDERGLSGLQCPFTKLRAWAKPKQRMKEVSQRFCSEDNLKNLYESLKTLRTTAEAHKTTPKCLKKKQVNVTIPDVVPSQKLSQKTMTDKAVPSESVEFTGVEDEPEQPASPTEKELLDTLHRRRTEEVALKIRADMLGILAQYEGSAQGKLLKFLRDELERLNQMKKFQAIQMIAERERWRREAAEAGRRQKENKLRDDNEMLSAEAGTVHKDLSTVFLKSVLKEEFEFTADALATEKIVELANSAEEDDLDSARLQGRDRRALYRAIISDSLTNQVFKVAERKLQEMHSDLQLDADINAMTEELFTSVEDAINQKYRTADSVVLVGEIVDELVADAVTYDFDLFTPDTSDDEFYAEREIGAIIDKLLRKVEPRPGAEEDFSDASEWQTHLDAEREAAAVIRKMIRRTIPADRWKNQSDRIVEHTLSETFNAAVYEVECLKASRVVAADDRLRAAISEIYTRLNANAKRPSSPASTNSLESASSHLLKSIPSTFELFDHPRDKSTVYVDSVQDGEGFSTRKINYVDPSEWVQMEPVELGRRHERYNILGDVAKRYQRRETTGDGVDEGPSPLPSSTRSTSSSVQSSDDVIASYSSSFVALDGLHPDLGPPTAGEEQRLLLSASSYEKACSGFERLSYNDDDEAKGNRK